VLYNKIQEVGMRYVSEDHYCYMDQEFEYHYMDSIINIPWVNYLDTVKNEITGPVILEFPSWKEKMKRTCRQARIMQKPIHPCCCGTNEINFGGFLAATIYHVGSHDRIEESYQKLAEWAKAKGASLGPNVYERYVVDYWTTANEDEFVTEIILPIRILEE
jgi:hypothetical protein